MRKLLWLTALAAIFYGGYWFVGSRAVLSGVETALADLRAEGIADVASVSLAGFPSRFDVTLTEPRLTSVDGKTSWQAPFVQFFALSYRPNHLIAVWPHAQTIRLGAETLTVHSSDLRASANFTAGLSLPLEKATLEGHGLTLSSNFGWSVLAEKLILAARRSEQGAASHELALAIDGLAPGDDLRKVIDPTARHPATADAARAALVVDFDRPVDRTLTETPLHITAFRTIDAHLKWGDMVLTATGDIRVDPAGYPAGRIEISATNWRDILALFVDGGALEPDLARTYAAGLAAIAKGAGDADVLKMPILFADRSVWLGPFLIGPAPRF